ncbi:uncharacterized protein LOC110715107 [Chenopodium quinoa]|uniref:uncharacterized protein LOC110715107 n=1 Tax=Chenopodium quinoa TaxID=63459 RepID=UPI000B77CB7A|nr:uncharacterized protein LOC110715107 [Chenopodium quinoa]
MELDDQGSHHASPADSRHIELLEAEGYGKQGKRPRIEEGSKAEDPKPPLFREPFLTLTKSGRKSMVKDLMPRFSSPGDFQALRRDPSKFVSSAFDSILKVGVTLSVLAEEYKRCAVQDMEGLRVELSEARTQIHDLKLELSSAKDALEKAKQDLTDAQEAKKTSIQAVETKVAEAKEEKKKMTEMLKKKENELTDLKKELTQARKRAEQSQEEVIVEWKKSPAFVDFQNELGYEAFEAGIADALAHMEMTFAALGLQEYYPKVREKVRDLLAATEAEERRKILADMNQQGGIDG